MLELSLKSLRRQHRSGTQEKIERHPNIVLYHQGALIFVATTASKTRLRRKVKTTYFELGVAVLYPVPVPLPFTYPSLPDPGYPPYPPTRAGDRLVGRESPV